MEFINLPILVASLLLTLSILTSLVSLRVGVPLILLLLCAGLVAGASGFEIFDVFKRPKIAFFIGSAALAVILFDSGFHTNLNSLRKASKAAFSLATIGVLLTTLLLMPVVRMVLGLDWVSALLLSAMISSTDAAAVFFLLRSQGVALREKIRATLEVESGSNDPMAIFLTLALIALIQQLEAGTTLPISFWVSSFLGQLFIGAGAGVLCARLIHLILKHIRLETPLYPVLVLGMAMSGFALTNMLGGSGFLAVYLCGLLLGAEKLPARTQISGFQKTAAWLSQITMFMSLGLFVTIDGLKQVWIPAVILGMALIIWARPVMTFLTLVFFKSYTIKEKIFVSFVGLRGATSILLALAPIVYGLAKGELFFNVIFVMVLLSLAIQGLLIPWAARLCGVVLSQAPVDIPKTEIDLPGLNDSALILYRLTDQAPVLNGTPLPRWARPSLVIRDGVSYPPGSIVKHLKSGDNLYVFSPSETRQRALDRLFGAVNTTEVLSDGTDFILTPDVTFGELKRLYHVSVPPQLEKMSVADLVQNELPDVEVGDRLSLDAMDLIIRGLENSRLTEVGLDIDPDRRQRIQTRTYVLRLIPRFTTESKKKSD